MMEPKPIPRYKRIGECKRCGSCCMGVGPDCEHTDRSEEKVVCKIYPNRPQCCVEYPALPPILYESCGYRFIDLWNEDRELKVGEA